VCGAKSVSKEQAAGGVSLTAWVVCSSITDAVPVNLPM